MFPPYSLIELYTILEHLMALNAEVIPKFSFNMLCTTGIA